MNKNQPTDWLSEHKIALLFDDSIPIDKLLFEFSDDNMMNSFTSELIKKYTPMNFICSCTGEGLLGRSHFFSSIFFNALVTLNRLSIHRLGFGHGIDEFEKEFKNSDIEDSPFYRVEEGSFDKKYANKHASLEKNALNSIIKILSLTKEKKGYHPYKFYWFLTKELNKNLPSASKYHSTLGLMRILLHSLFEYLGINNGEYPSADYILAEYKKIFEEKVSQRNIVVLPIGVDHDFKLSCEFVDLFFDAFSERLLFSDNDNINSFNSLISLASYLIEILCSYPSPFINNKVQSFVNKLDDKLSFVYNNIEHDKDNYFKFCFEYKWKKKIETSIKYLPILEREPEAFCSAI